MNKKEKRSLNMEMDKQVTREGFNTDFENVLDNTEMGLMMTPEEMFFWSAIEGEGEGSYTRKSFVFHPNYLSTYDALKQENPEWAIIYVTPHLLRDCFF